MIPRKTPCNYCNCKNCQKYVFSNLPYKSNKIHIYSFCMSCACNLDSSQYELCIEGRAWNFSESNQCLMSRLFLQPEPSISQNDHIAKVYEQHLGTRIGIIFKSISSIFTAKQKQYPQGQRIFNRFLSLFFIFNN